MIEDTPEARKKAGRDLQAILDTIRSFEDRSGFFRDRPNMIVKIDPREDGRTYPTFADYFAEGEEGETYPDYLNRVGRKFFVVQGSWSRGSTKSLDDVIWKWNCGEAVDISKGLRETVWKEMKDEADSCSWMKGMLRAEMGNWEDDE